jgi:hypothetical protein
MQSIRSVELSYKERVRELKRKAGFQMQICGYNQYDDWTCTPGENISSSIAGVRQLDIVFSPNSAGVLKRIFSGARNETVAGTPASGSPVFLCGGANARFGCTSSTNCSNVDPNRAAHSTSSGSHDAPTQRPPETNVPSLCGQLATVWSPRGSRRLTQDERRSGGVSRT